MKTNKLSKTTIRQAQDALQLLFPTCRFTVAPNGLPGLWVKDAEGYGFDVSFSAGKAGVGVRVRKFVGSSPVTVTGNLHPENEVIPQTDACEVSCTVYRQDEYSQAFKKWYAADADENGNKSVPYPGDAGLTSSYEAAQ